MASLHGSHACACNGMQASTCMLLRITCASLHAGACTLCMQSCTFVRGALWRVQKSQEGMRREGEGMHGKSRRHLRASCAEGVARPVVVDCAEGVLPLELQHGAGLVLDRPGGGEGREGEPEQAHAAVHRARHRRLAARRHRNAAHCTCAGPHAMHASEPQIMTTEQELGGLDMTCSGRVAGCRGSALPNRMCLLIMQASCTAHALIPAPMLQCRASAAGRQARACTCVADQASQAALARHIPEPDHAICAPRCLGMHPVGLSCCQSICAI